MPKKHEAKKYDGIEFNFVTIDYESTMSLTGTVLIRPGEMVIDIQDSEYNTTRTLYLIVGTQSEKFFAGSNTAVGKQMPKVQAKWQDFNELFIGHWIEDGNEYTFSFRLPKRPAHQ